YVVAALLEDAAALIGRALALGLAREERRRAVLRDVTGTRAHEGRIGAVGVGPAGLEAFGRPVRRVPAARPPGAHVVDERVALLDLRVELRRVALEDAEARPTAGEVVARRELVEVRRLDEREAEPGLRLTSLGR